MTQHSHPAPPSALDFVQACKNNDMVRVRALFTTSGLSVSERSDAFNEGFVSACESAHLETVQYLLMQIIAPDTSEQGYLKAQFSALRWACSHDHLGVVKYLLSESGLSDQPWSDHNLHDALGDAYSSRHLHPGMQVVHYLLYDRRMKIEPLYLNNWDDHLVQDMVQQGVRRDLFFKLNQTLETHECLTPLNSSHPQCRKI